MASNMASYLVENWRLPIGLMLGACGITPYSRTLEVVFVTERDLVLASNDFLVTAIWLYAGGTFLKLKVQLVQGLYNVTKAEHNALKGKEPRIQQPQRRLCVYLSITLVCMMAVPPSANLPPVVAGLLWAERHPIADKSQVSHHRQ